ncbi:alpha/beta fold hydrolase [Rudanella lutea]|uniref:alpha/beta fold hydrolase n=1 Tax=Rudanella lutea TaxID=451374 RepID=UPI0003600ADA|nr:alpha/beta hydrolase [Rudanella lutea]
MKLHTNSEGHGEPTFVLLHFFGSSGREYAGVISALAGRYRCIAPDLRGFGDSATAPDGDYSVDAMTDDVLSLIEQTVTGPFVVVGHSMSGKVALNLAARQPAGLLGLVLLAPSPLSPEPIEPDERQRLLTTHGQRSAAEQTRQNITSAPLSEAAQEQIVADDLRSSDAAWQAWLTHGSRENLEDRAGRITLPVQIVLGADDEHITRQLMQETLLRVLPQARLTLLSGAAHVLPLEKPVEVADILGTFAAWLLSRQIPTPYAATKPTLLAD